MQKNQLNNEKFIKRAFLVHKDLYDYSKINYINYNTKIIIICKIHGEFLQSPDNHLHCKGCPNCRNNKLAKERSFNINIFTEKANKIHNNKYNYELSLYKNAKTKIKIICPLHGIFQQTPDKHLYDNCGCKKCGNYLNTFKKNDWIKKANGREGIFYIIKCFNNEEEFFKFGITYTTLKIRYSGKTRMPYDYQIIRQIKSNDLYYIWDLEKRFMQRKKNNQYAPLLYFKGGKYECFK